MLGQKQAKSQKSLNYFADKKCRSKTNQIKNIHGGNKQ